MSKFLVWCDQQRSRQVNWRLRAGEGIFCALSKSSGRNPRTADDRGRTQRRWWSGIYHSYSPLALWNTYSRPLTVRTPSFITHFLFFASANHRSLKASLALAWLHPHFKFPRTCVYGRTIDPKGVISPFPGSTKYNREERGGGI